ncbi:hypothetical protein AX14_013060 [Amanita brunnescens Koide BX004]|nr:hypothetical protein AX14_013713 [Amanita brunnescens Koide BX004]KAF8712490.1 hypothetical protein AX14_013060 [Amanita brunnescens Koide BX004]
MSEERKPAVTALQETSFTPSSTLTIAAADATLAGMQEPLGTFRGSLYAVDSLKVFLDGAEDPQCLAPWRKRYAVAVISFASFCITASSSMATFAEKGIAKEFHVSSTISILAVSLYVLGLGVGPFIAAPLSEVYGRRYIYLASYGLFFVFSWPVAFAPDIYIHLIFRFVTGFCGSAFFAVSGGSISDMFSSDKVANPVAVYTLGAFAGPVLGPVISGFINQNLYWRWTYYILIIWTFALVVALTIFVPETYVPVLVRRKVARLRQKSMGMKYWSEHDNDDSSLARSIILSFYIPIQHALTDRMAVLLDLWCALLLGILYLVFQVFPVVFGGLHHFSMQLTGLTFLGIGTGIFFAFGTQPFWNRHFSRQVEKYGGMPPPEVHLVMAQVGAILVPLSLFSTAFTTYRHVHYIAPIIASLPFGSGIFLVFKSVFIYLVIAYRPIAASALALNSTMRLTFAAVFPLFAHPMYVRLGAVGATALLAGLATLMTPLPFIFAKIGARLRSNTRFAA